MVGAATFDASADIGLATTYAGSPSAFEDVALDPVDFYSNAKVSSLAFGGDFTITVQVSANANDANSGAKQGAFDTQSSTVATGNVRTVILRNTETASGIVSYQLIVVSFQQTVRKPVSARTGARNA